MRLAPIEALGFRTVRYVATAGRMAVFLGQILRALVTPPTRLRRLVGEIYDSGVLSLLIVCGSGIAVGAVALVWPGITALAFLYLLAAWAILTGIFEVITPLAYPMGGGRALLTVLAGVLSIIFGILIASQPSSGLLAVVWLIGVYAILFGIMYIVMYFESRSLATSVA